MVYIRRLYLRNFIGIKTGLKKSEIDIDFDKFDSKRILLILGDNGTGKTTFMSVLHPLPGTTDKRDKFIIDGKEGVKIIEFDRSDGCHFICKIVYSPSKTGHNSKGFIRKISDNIDIELNPSGTINSYKELVESELGISDAILKLTSQNDTTKGIVDMTATDRKVNMNAFLPDDIYSEYYQIVDKGYRELKMRFNILVDNLSKLGDEDTLNSELKKVTKKINELVEHRDKYLQRIAIYNTRISTIKESGIEERYNELTKEISKSRAKIENLSLAEIQVDADTGSFASLDSTSLLAIEKAIDKVRANCTSNRSYIQSNNAKKSVLLAQRNQISSSIMNKRESVNDISTDISIEKLRAVYKEYTARVKELEPSTKKILPGVTKNHYFTGYQIVQTIRDSIVNYFGPYDHELVRAVCEGEYSDVREDDLRNRRRELEQQSSDIIAKIKSIENNMSDDVLAKRPENCHIDDCPFIYAAYKAKEYSANIPKYTKKLDEINAAIANINHKLDLANDIREIQSDINNIVQYVNLNMDTIQMLPYSSEYSTEEAIRRSIIKGASNLEKCDKFDEYVEAIEDAEELTELITIKIPKIESEIALLTTNGKFIDSVLSDIARLESDKQAINDELASINAENEQFESLVADAEKLLESLDLYKVQKIEFDNCQEVIANDTDEINRIAKKLDEMYEYKNEIAKYEDKLSEVETELEPLTREREVLKTDILKVAAFKDERDAVSHDMGIVEIIRSALSVKDDGIPVSALQWFLDSVRQTTNALLEKSFGGNIYLDEFIIDQKNFQMPYRKHAEYSPDISYASSAERSFISLAITMSIIEEIVSKYTIITLDELDGPFSQKSREIFMTIIYETIERANITQLFMVSHNAEMYLNQSDVGYIVFPGADTDGLSERDIIRVSNC